MRQVKHYSNSRKKRQVRSRVKIFGTQKRPRVSIFRSSKNLFVQIIDDEKRNTIIGIGDMHLQKAEKNKIKRAKILGKQIAETAKKQGVVHVVFDRSGYTYHGRVQALAEGLLEGGLQF